MSYYYGDIKMSFDGRLEVLRELPKVLEEWKADMDALSREAEGEINFMLQELNKELDRLKEIPGEERAEVSLRYFADLASVPVAALCEIAEKRPEIVINAEGELSDTVTDQPCDYEFFSDEGETSLEGDGALEEYFLEELDF